MVEMHADRDLRIDFRHRVHHVLEHDVVGVGPGAARGLDDDGRIDLVGGLHDRQRLLHVVDVEGRHAVVVFGGVIEQFAQRDAGHDLELLERSGTAPLLVTSAAKAQKSYGLSRIPALRQHNKDFPSYQIVR